MTKPAVTLRNTKGSALNYSELDTNFTNLRDSTINFSDGTNTLSMDLNDTISVLGQTNHNIRVTVSEGSNNIVIDNTLSDYTLDPMGFENLVDAEVSFENASRTFTIEPAGANYKMWYQGRQYTISTAKTVTIPDVTGIYLIYFEEDVLNYVLGNDPQWNTQVPVSYVYWNGDDNNAMITKELHGISMDWKTKEYLHETAALAYADGFVASNYTVAGDGSLNSHAQLDISGGVCYDQDIRVEITHSNTPTPNTWEQDLQGPARIPVIYHNGPTGTWTFSGFTDYPFVNGISRVSYNLNTAGTWTIPDAPNTHYVAYWIVATNFLNSPIISIMGQRSDNKLEDAVTNNTWDSLNLTNFPAEELRPLYRIIVRTADAYTNDPKAYFAQVDDFRLNVTTAAGASTGLTAIVQDTNPQLGGNLDVNGFEITAISGQHVTLATVGIGNIYLDAESGNVILDGLSWPKVDGTADQVLYTNGAGGLGWKDAANINTGTTNQLTYYNNSTQVSGTAGLVFNPLTGYGIGGSAAGARLQLWASFNSSNAYLDLNSTSAILRATNLTLRSNAIELGGNSGVSSNVTVTTNSTGDLILNTNNGTNSGTIRIFDGVNGDITLAPNGTGKVDLAGAIKTNTTTGTPTDTTTPTSWLKVTVGASDYYLPLYQ